MGDFYPTPPLQLTLGHDGYGVLVRHPELDLALEVSMRGSSTYCLAYEWPGHVTRSNLSSGEVPSEWMTLASGGTHMPVQLKRVGPGQIAYRFLDPTAPAPAWHDLSRKALSDASDRSETASIGGALLTAVGAAVASAVVAWAKSRGEDPPSSSSPTV